MVTLDISDSHIKLLVVKEKKVMLATSVALEPGLVKFGVIEDKTTVSQLIIRLMAAHHLRDKKVHVCISGIHSIYRIISLPRLSGNLLTQAVRREMERITAVPIDEVYLSWQTLVVTSIDMTVCAIAIPVNTCDALMTTLQQSGLESTFVTIRPMAISRLVNEKNAIVLNIQPAEYDIAIVINGVPQLLRSVAFPGGEMPETQKIAMVKEDLEKTASFYNASHNQDIVTRDIAVFVTGELIEMATQTIQYRVKQIPNLMSYPADFIAAHYAGNIGMSLMNSENYANPVRLAMNIIPQVYLPKFRLGAILGWGAIALAVVIIALLGYATFQETMSTAALRAKVNTAQAHLRQLQSDEQTIKKLQTQLAQLQATAARLTQPLANAKDQRVKMNGDLASVTRLLPGTVNLVSINWGRSLTITGTAPDDKIVLSYVRELRDTSRFSSVMLSDLTEIKTNQWSFVLELK